MADALNQHNQVRLTANPLQRVGAFALAALARVSHPDQLTTDAFEAAVDNMTRHLLITADVAKAADPGGFWLGASYMLWPNSKINPTARGKQSPDQRRGLIGEWRALPEPAAWPDAPCAYCERPACKWFGKVDIPLGASVEHRNTTAPGHEGTPLCYPCVASLWAFPYGASLTGGRAAAIHSWDDAFLAPVTRLAVKRTLANAQAPAVKTKAQPTWYARELAVLEAVRSYDQRIHAGVELIVLSNSNKEQLLRVQEMEQPIAQWLRSTTTRSDRRSGYRVLVAAQASKSVSGEAFLARRAFEDPAAIMHRTTAYLLGRVSAGGVVPAEVSGLAPLTYSYCIEVLNMDEKDVARIKDLAARLGALLGQDSRPGPFGGFMRANAKGGDLYGWFRTQSVQWLLKTRPAGMPRTLLPVEDYRLLFDDERAWSHRRLLVFAVMEALVEAGWQPKGSAEELEDVSDAAASFADEEAN
ncbi:hypothetical protein EDD95_8186 [Streptomyces sp. CEV 2-1]|uniref:hypothetical protein n=1 Tax=Streptomyces sp. CEV 2-1 TaxID=2485153 RepID=UPI000F46D338|nr:hypothetical protein [Streptomyces sp. CEV 2-1]ROQ65319.1 hypothetical protein EDD95_8186 [Streptomyces sp. CEV 2-1]